MNDSIRIETVENGYVVYTRDGFHTPGTVVGPIGRFAFEHFESLTAWLRQNLQKPTASPTIQRKNT